MTIWYLCGPGAETILQDRSQIQIKMMPELLPHLCFGFDRDEAIFFRSSAHDVQKMARLTPSEALIYELLYHAFPSFVPDQALLAAFTTHRPLLDEERDEQQRIVRQVSLLRRRIAPFLRITRMVETGYLLAASASAAPGADPQEPEPGN